MSAPFALSNDAAAAAKQKRQAASMAAADALAHLFPAVQSTDCQSGRTKPSKPAIYVAGILESCPAELIRTAAGSHERASKIRSKYNWTLAERVHAGA